MTLARCLAIALATCLACGGAAAGLLEDENWQEGPVPMPPAFNIDRLVPFDVSPQSPMVYGIDPQSLSISPADRVVRYVVVARSPSGVRNAFYEGIRCATAEVRTYARHNGNQWVMVSESPWLPMTSRPSRHALQLARQGACDSAGTPLRADDVLRRLQQSALHRGS